MLLLAGVVGANLTPSKERRTGGFRDSDGTLLFICDRSFGWPFEAFGRRNLVLDPPPESDSIVEVELWSIKALALNIVIGLAIPIAGLFACEFVLRRWGKAKE